MGISMLVIRHWPKRGRMGELRAGLGVSGSRLFLHGDGVVLAEPGRLPDLVGAPQLEVCAASWRRRYAGPSDPRFCSSSLTLMYQALDRADDYRIWGCGGASSWHRGDGPAPGWLLEVVTCPVDARDRTETLEFVLGAAAFGLDARVLIRGPGYNHLLTDAARGWAQLSDFDLLELICQAPDDVALKVPARRIDTAGLGILDRASVRRLVL